MMLANSFVPAGFRTASLSSSKRQPARQPSTSGLPRAQANRVTAAASLSSEQSTRRSLLFSGAALVGTSQIQLLPASAEGDYFTFYGAANPPATYGGVGGTTREKARYSFVVPPNFKEDAVTKVDKGATGIDSRFVTGGRKKSTVFVITLRNEGSRDGSGFALKDADSALKVTSGALFALQDAISAGSVSSKPNNTGGFSYEITGGPECYAANISTSKDGRLFAIFVSAPGAAWETDKAELIKIRDSFQVYDLAE